MCITSLKCTNVMNVLYMIVIDVIVSIIKALCSVCSFLYITSQVIITIHVNNGLLIACII